MPHELNQIEIKSLFSKLLCMTNYYRRCGLSCGLSVREWETLSRLLSDKKINVDFSETT